MRLIDADSIIKDLSAMKTQLGYDAIDIDGMIKALKEAEEVEAITQSNAPLTLEELREMDGEPVWVSTGRLHEWCIVHSCHSDDVIGGGVVMTRRTAEKRIYQYANYGKTWIAYRRKLEGDGQDG